ncbi:MULTISPECIES: alpha/beta hydrolase [Kordiimonas]|jgi:pimeloyl-ACP methyl ester carboxylesterase|uniref:alpha/beta hydrolase n=1 Tax=Kordiimonas TaxID=288021 RepID=UPI00257EA0B4|nr:alpha/beta fold hydrolase [Kordiimonas sp. UBA4487]
MVEEISICTPDRHFVEGSVYRCEQNVGFALLVHGITADRHEWGFFDYLARELNEKGYTVLSIDYRGHGQSKMPIEKLSLSGVFIDIKAAWEWIEKECSNCSKNRVIIGNSFGGGLSYLFGQLCRSVDKVVMTCPVTSYISDLSRVAEDWEAIPASSFIPYASKKLPASIVTDMYAYDILIQTCPLIKETSVFHGTADSDVPFAESQQFVKDRCEIAQIYPLDGMDHSFSAPEGAPDQALLSPKYRLQAAQVIAGVLAENQLC